MARRRQDVVERTWVLELGQVVFRSQLYKLHQIPNLSDPQVTQLYNGKNSVNPQLSSVVQNSKLPRETKAFPNSFGSRVSPD